MENYSKGRNVEEEWTKEKVGIPCLPAEFTWMHVKCGSRMYGLLNYAIKSFKETGVVLWSASGPAVCKAISCAEIMKKRCNEVNQITRICYHKVQEYWTPNIEGLDELVVSRQVPAIHVLLSREPLDKDDVGYQTSKRSNNFRRAKKDYEERRSAQKKFKPKIDTEQFEESGLRSKNFTKRQKKKNVDLNVTNE